MCPKAQDPLRGSVIKGNHLHNARVSSADRLPFPNLPRGISPGAHVIQKLFVLERVHACPESFVLERYQLFFLYESLKRLVYQFLAVSDMSENFPSEHEEAPVHPNVGFREMPDAFYSLPVIYFHHMETTG